MISGAQNQAGPSRYGAPYRRARLAFFHTIPLRIASSDSSRVRAAYVAELECVPHVSAGARARLVRLPARTCTSEVARSSFREGTNDALRHVTSLASHDFRGFVSLELSRQYPVCRATGCGADDARRLRGHTAGHVHLSAAFRRPLSRPLRAHRYRRRPPTS